MLTTAMLAQSVERVTAEREQVRFPGPDHTQGVKIIEK